MNSASLEKCLNRNVFLLALVAIMGCGGENDALKTKGSTVQGLYGFNLGERLKDTYKVDYGDFPINYTEEHPKDHPTFDRVMVAVNPDRIIYSVAFSKEGSNPLLVENLKAEFTKKHGEPQVTNAFGMKCYIFGEGRRQITLVPGDRGVGVMCGDAELNAIETARMEKLGKKLDEAAEAEAAKYPEVEGLYGFRLGDPLSDEYKVEAGDDGLTWSKDDVNQGPFDSLTLHVTPERKIYRITYSTTEPTDRKALLDSLKEQLTQKYSPPYTFGKDKEFVRFGRAQRYITLSPFGSKGVWLTCEDQALGRADSKRIELDQKAKLKSTLPPL